MKVHFRRISVFLFFAVLWLSSALYNFSNTDSVLYILIIFASVLSLYMIKNRKIGALAAVAISAVFCFYKINYLFYAAPSLFLIIAHKDLTSSEDTNHNRKNDDSLFYNCISLGFLSGIATLIYSFIKISELSSMSDFYYLRYELTIMLFLLLFIWLFAKSLGAFENKKSQTFKFEKNSKKVQKFRVIYAANIICYLGTVFYYHSIISGTTMDVRIIFFPWFLYVYSIIYNKDPFVQSLFQKVERVFTEFANTDRVRK
ncbi:MAG: hypothetical protein ACI4XE_07720 [Acutalibacteraceae bacterium]